MSAKGRYCLAVCYCGKCAHYVPIKRTPPLDPKVWGEQEPPAKEPT